MSAQTIVIVTRDVPKDRWLTALITRHTAPVRPAGEPHHRLDHR